MKLIKYFDAFLTDEVNLNQTRLNLLGERVEAITNFLQSCDHTIAGMFIQTIPQGSYAHRTIIKPMGAFGEFDADLLLELNEDVSWAAEDYVEQLYQAFRTSPVYKNMVSRRSRCVVVNYAGDFHIDVVPYLERHGENFITNCNEDEFERTNPDGFSVWLDEKNRTTGGRLVKVIRLMKYVRDYKGTFSVKSFILTMLLADRVNDAFVVLDGDHYKDVPTVLKNVLVALNEYLQDNENMPLLTDPSCPSEDFNHRWDQKKYANFRNWIEYYSHKIVAAYDEADKAKSLALWQEIFGSDFKVPSSSAVVVKEAVLKADSRTEQVLDRDLGIPIRLDERYRVRINGRILPQDGFRSFSGSLRSRGGIVSKHRTIRFTIEGCNVPEPFQIYWKVKNRGEASAKANCLRGEITLDRGSRSRDEPTAYAGNHYVECYVVKSGVCVATDRQPVIIT
jgi:Second Messenger Oligonucleotide or Dinucleotide Synthetase domain/Adenylyl/Guanylyl and SMODS C-terminal sensor domain